jgi:hypothetical protein
MRKRRLTSAAGLLALLAWLPACAAAAEDTAFLEEQIQHERQVLARWQQQAATGPAALEPFYKARCAAGARLVELYEQALAAGRAGDGAKARGLRSEAEVWRSRQRVLEVALETGSVVLPNHPPGPEAGAEEKQAAPRVAEVFAEAEKVRAQAAPAAGELNPEAVQDLARRISRAQDLARRLDEFLRLARQKDDLASGRAREEHEKLRALWDERLQLQDRLIAAQWRAVQAPPGNEAAEARQERQRARSEVEAWELRRQAVQDEIEAERLGKEAPPELKSQVEEVIASRREALRARQEGAKPGLTEGEREQLETRADALAEKAAILQDLLAARRSALAHRPEVAGRLDHPDVKALDDLAAKTLAEIDGKARQRIEWVMQARELEARAAAQGHEEARLRDRLEEVAEQLDDALEAARDRDARLKELLEPDAAQEQVQEYAEKIRAFDRTFAGLKARRAEVVETVRALLAEALAQAQKGADLLKAGQAPACRAALSAALRMDALFEKTRHGLDQWREAERRVEGGPGADAAPEVKEALAEAARGCEEFVRATVEAAKPPGGGDAEAVAAAHLKALNAHRAMAKAVAKLLRLVPDAKAPKDGGRPLFEVIPPADF